MFAISKCSEVVKVIALGKLQDAGLSLSRGRLTVNETRVMLGGILGKFYSLIKNLRKVQTNT